jgi:hypothetical protein
MPRRISRRTRFNGNAPIGKLLRRVEPAAEFSLHCMECLLNFVGALCSESAINLWRAVGLCRAGLQPDRFAKSQDLLFRKCQEKQIPRAKSALGMTSFEFFRSLFSR